MFNVAGLSSWESGGIPTAQGYPLSSSLSLRSTPSTCRLPTLSPSKIHWEYYSSYYEALFSFLACADIDLNPSMQADLDLTALATCEAATVVSYYT